MRFRWENQRTGAAGWMPAVAGGWRKGNASPRRQPLATHGSGGRFPPGRHTFVGLYPLLRDNTCHFLVADFDGPAAMLDALAYCKAVRANQSSTNCNAEEGPYPRDTQPPPKDRIVREARE